MGNCRRGCLDYCEGTRVFYTIDDSTAQTDFRRLTMPTIYLIRHAEAVPHGDPNFEDDDRPLLDLGRRQSRQLGAALMARGIRFDAVISSSVPRALAKDERV